MPSITTIPSSQLSSTSLSTSLSTSIAVSTSSSATSSTPNLPSPSPSSSIISELQSTSATQSSEPITLSSTTDFTSSSITSSSLPTTSTIRTASITPTSTSILTGTPLTTSSTAVITTRTSVVTVLPTLAPASGSAVPPTHNGFFANKGAVAGVFTVVGLVVLGLFVLLATTIIHRRRAQQFDLEVEAAAAEAAAASAPHFLDDDDDPYQHHGDHTATYTNHPQFSDVSSHGTYSQPPLVPQDTYNMREVGPPPGELYAVPYIAGGAAGAAGVGVARVRSSRDPGAFAGGFEEGSTPYPVFVRPAAFHSGVYGDVGSGNGGGHNSADAGIGDGVQQGMPMNHPPNAAYDNLQGLHPGQYVQESDLTRNPSQATTSHASSTHSDSTPSPPLPKEQPSFTAHYASVPGQEAGDGGHGYTNGAGDRQSYSDEDEDEGRPRVLKVANV